MEQFKHEEPAIRAFTDSIDDSVDADGFPPLPQLPAELDIDNYALDGMKKSSTSNTIIEVCK